MGFPACYTELVLPRLLLHTLSLLAFLRCSILALLRSLGLSEFLESEPTRVPSDPDALEPDALRRRRPLPLLSSSSSTLTMRQELLPVVRFSDLVDPPAEICAVCLHEFEAEDEIQRLANCRHVFHRCCLDRWMGYDQSTCPLCRTTVFLSEDSGDVDVECTMSERLWADPVISEFDEDPYAIAGLL